MTARTITQLAHELREGSTTPRRLLDNALAHAEAAEPSLHAYLALTRELAERQADEAGRMLERDPDGASPLCGVPMALKDVLCVDGVETTAGSRILSGWKPPYTGTAVQRLFDAGAVCVGKTNCDEFAMGSSTENSAFGPAGNPWDVERVPGGSSGGSAATVAAGTVPYALGSDTGGSIRQPASLSGVVGFKPTYGRVSRYGLIAFASSLDQIGPLTRSVEDAAIVYAAIAGGDPRDSTCDPRPLGDPLETLGRGVEGLRLGVPREYMGEGIDPDVRARVEEAMAVLEGLGASLREVSLPTTHAGLSTYYIIAPAECSSNLARYDGVRFGLREDDPSLTEMYLRTRDRGFGVEVKRRVMLGTYALSSGYYDAYYRKAQKVRTVIAEEFARVFEDVDALVSPTSPSVAFTMGDRDDPLSMYMCDVVTLPVNLAGLPGISVPCGFSPELPVGLQVIAPRFEDARVFQVAHAYEQATEWHTSQSPLAATAA
ncbi:MAG: Asp-tRNA(Asn)/Glu-tRNA(Gln) amidotransferase subunit GatA [Candidatus Dormibacteraeota bacterium]|nr:Asp-tRNA(Asn)/Glu-tRNA(Gln) amidotransferase subunit GatA [Candidatus Dormibacteraeota bacterium]MBV9525850.1 Asp-tRNA(Asn)/Glu-tRNA(Gln) amidotransferase subunit GatA [Candidatus Dormibacteraeota bacterium]